MYNLVPKSSTPVLTSNLFDNWFDDIFSDTFRLKPRAVPLKNYIRTNSFYDVDETESEISIKVNVPTFNEDLSKEDIDVSYADGVLTIQHANESNNNSKTNTPSKFYLQYAVRSSEYEIDTSKIDASLKGNILTINLPKVETIDRNTLKIEVK